MRDKEAVSVKERKGKGEMGRSGVRTTEMSQKVIRIGYERLEFGESSGFSFSLG